MDATPSYPMAPQQGQGSANGQPLHDPLRLTLARWLNKRKPVRDIRGGWTERYSKVLAHKRSFDEFAYGSDSGSDWRGPLQRAVICSPRSGLIVIDVDDEPAYLATRTAHYLRREHAWCTRGAGFHIPLDCRAVPPDQRPRQGPIPGADIKSNGFVPLPGSIHWSEERYEPVFRPDGLVTVITATPAIIAAIRADREAHHPASANGNGAGGTGGGHDGEIAGATLAMVIRRLRAGWQPGPELEADVHAEWARIAIPRDPAWPFGRKDFGRHYGGAVPKALEIIKTGDQPLTEDAVRWAQSMAAHAPAHVKAGQPPVRRAEIVRASAVPMRVARFLLRTPQVQIPMGELTIAAGREGTGKSQCSLGWAAALTIGKLPGDAYGRPRSVVVVAKEDSWEHTIKPRLVACGADLDKVLWLRVTDAVTGSSYELSLPADLAELERVIRAEDVGLVILDPLLSVLSSRLDDWKSGPVRHALEPLAQVAHRTGCSFAGLAHFAKMEGRDPASLISGSHAFKDVARAIIVFAMDSEDTGVMSQVKNSLGKMPRESLEYRICEMPLAIQVPTGDGKWTAEWTGVPVFYPGSPTSRHVEDLLASGSKRAVAAARDFLRGALSGGWRLAKEVEEEARQNGIAGRTLDRARSDLRVSARKQADGSWLIGFPGM